MKTIRLKPCAGAAVRRAGFNMEQRLVIPLVGAMLFAVAGCHSAAAAGPTYKLFGREIGGYSSKDDVPAIVIKELGPKASVADWEEIKKQFGQSEASLKAFCEKVGLAPEGSACVTLGGQRFWQGSPRQYFLYRADHKKPDDFMVHDQLQNEFLLLGSWINPRPVLVKLTDFSAADAAKFAKWDGMVATLKERAAEKMKEFAGVYTLVKVNGKKVPAAVQHEGASLEIRSGRFTIGPDGRCRSRMVFVPPSHKEASVETAASYTLGGPDLHRLDMQWEGAGSTDGTVDGDTFTMENEGMLFEYSKSPGPGPATSSTPVAPSDRSKSARISATEAKDHYNESLVVTGQVAQVTFRPTIVYLNLGKPYPSTPCAVAIFSAATNQFGDLAGLKGKAVQVQGKVVEYRGRPEIVISNASQLVVLDQ